MAERLAQTFHTLPAVRAADEASLVQIDGIGPAIAAAIVRGLKDSAAVLVALLEVVHIVEPAKVEDTGHLLFGKSVVFTGTMATLDRKSAQKRVNALGGKTPSSVTAELDYLVIGDDGSSLLSGGEKSTKEKAAEKLKAKGAPVQIISETAFLALLA